MAKTQARGCCNEAVVDAKGADSLSDALRWAMQANDMGLGIAWEIECDDGSRLDRQEIVEMVWRRKRELIANPPKKY
jgi:hypothetical protein